MFYNGANCDIYIGKGAGKKLLNDIRNAEFSIKIVSPYLSPILITELIGLKQKNIDIELITTDSIEDFYGSYDKNIHKLIIQNREIDAEAVKKRKKWKDTVKTLTAVTVGLFIAMIILVYYLQSIKMVFGLIPLTILYLIIDYFKKKIKKKRIYTYWYSHLFPFKVYMSPDSTPKSDTFIHCKIYLIDEKIAYLGSLNFTASGTKYNYETRVRSTDSNLIKEIKEELNQLMNHSPLPERNIQTWGQQLYNEPIN